jgi:PAS domain S-box-containing protein
MIVDAQDLIQTTLLGEAAENAPLGIFVADDEMGYIAVNRRACELLGYDREELLRSRLPTSVPSRRARSSTGR